MPPRSDSRHAAPAVDCNFWCEYRLRLRARIVKHHPALIQPRFLAVQRVPIYRLRYDSKAAKRTWTLNGVWTRQHWTMRGQTIFNLTLASHQTIPAMQLPRRRQAPIYRSHRNRMSGSQAGVLRPSRTHMLIRRSRTLVWRLSQMPCLGWQDHLMAEKN